MTNIVDQLESHGKTWRDYQQSLSLCEREQVRALVRRPGNQLYERKHNPFVSYTDIAFELVADGERRRPRPAGDADLWSGDAPDYNFIAPDQCHDMHGIADTAA